MNTTITDLANKLKEVLVARDFDVSKYSMNDLQTEVELAIGEINSCRRFTQTSSKLYDEKYEYLIIPMCLSSIAKIGAEGESSHSENGISRTYSDKLTSQIIPLIK